ncbi:putative quinol monooxygenase [Brooklawnia cerclae]|uniref:Quinol monooxygenase YgiN n=1 Tax=Brooklawnia cerclae TaxID=349934 RepID=A0ABX0SHS3_9ACTN|nr:putative quinol monooxygenase [Brooklawnia cerclae]NIH56301.1 quinol monooxygenase YgiN [Brooklawnia cerclae]
MSVTLNALITVKPEFRESYLALARTMIEKSRAEEGNISYTLYENIEAPSSFVFVEEWVDVAAIEEVHNVSAHFIEFRKQNKEMLERETVVKRYFPAE